LAILAVVVAVLAVLVLLDLFVTFAIIRRLRRSDEPGARAPVVPLPTVGMRIPEFEAVTFEGTKVSSVDLRTGVTVVGFVAPGCGPCARLRDELIRLGPAEDTLLFVDSALRDGELDPVALEMVSGLAGICDVVPMENGAIYTKTFGIGGFPTLMRVVDGTVVAAGLTLEEVAIPVAPGVSAAA
jgi:thiol-disulfide isomerase/thioredoxin